MSNSGLNNLRRGIYHAYGSDIPVPTFQIIGPTNIVSSMPGSLVMPVGTQVGDLIVVVGVGNRNLNVSATFVTGLYTMGAPAAGRVTINSDQLSSIANMSVSTTGAYDGHAYGVVLRGLVTPGPSSLRSETPIGGVNATSTTLPGFIKTPGSGALLGVVSRRNTAGDVSVPAGWTDIVGATGTVYSSRVGILPSYEYTNSDTIEFGLGAGTGNGGAFVMELMGP